MVDAVNAFKAQQPTWHWPRQTAPFRPTVLVNEPEFVPSPVDTNLNSLNSLPLLPQTDLGLRKPKTLASSSNGNGILVIPFDKTPITHAVHGTSKGLVNHEEKIQTNQPFNEEQPAVIQDEKNVVASIKVAEQKTPPTKTSFGFNLNKLKQGEKKKAPIDISPPKTPPTTWKLNKLKRGEKKEAPFEIPPPKTPPTTWNLEKLKQGKKKKAPLEIPPPKTPPTKTTFSFNLEKLKQGQKKETASIKVPPPEDGVHKEVLIEVNPPKQEAAVNSGTYDPFEFNGLNRGVNSFRQSSFGPPSSEEFDMNVGLEMVEAAIEGLKRGLGHDSPSVHHADAGIETEIGIDMVEEAIESIQPQTKRTARGKQQILRRIKK